eukprot:Nk52_evm36s1360 gene=Nk52_evmTU36s1360
MMSRVLFAQGSLFSPVMERGSMVCMATSLGASKGGVRSLYTGAGKIWGKLGGAGGAMEQRRVSSLEISLGRLRKYTRSSALFMGEGSSSIPKDAFSRNKKSSSSSVRIGPMFLILPLISFGLGVWQTYRLQWKKGMQAELEERQKMPPIGLDEHLSGKASSSREEPKEMVVGRKVKVTGHYLNERSVFIGPRTRTVANSNAPEIGYHVITPIRCRKTNHIYLVNRGFVPQGEINSKGLKAVEDKSLIEAIGFVHQNKPRGKHMPMNNPEKKEWFWADVDAISYYCEALPVMVDLCDDTKLDTQYPLVEGAQIKLKNDHLEYLLTWYGLSAATLLMYFKFR